MKCSCEFKLILMDCYMPLMTGYEAAKTLKQKIKMEILPEIYIVACSAAVT